MGKAGASSPTGVGAGAVACPLPARPPSPPRGPPGLTRGHTSLPSSLQGGPRVSTAAGQLEGWGGRHHHGLSSPSPSLQAQGPHSLKATELAWLLSTRLPAHSSMSRGRGGGQHGRWLPEPTSCSCLACSLLATCFGCTLSLGSPWSCAPPFTGAAGCIWGRCRGQLQPQPGPQATPPRDPAGPSPATPAQGGALLFPATRPQPPGDAQPCLADSATTPALWDPSGHSLAAQGTLHRQSPGAAGPGGWDGGQGPRGDPQRPPKAGHLSPQLCWGLTDTGERGQGKTQGNNTGHIVVILHAGTDM